jgi:hypothetical protein
MKNLKTYKMFESSQGITQELTPEQTEWLDECSSFGGWELNEETGLVDVHSNFNCSGQGLRDLKGVRFGFIEGTFYCQNNQLESLIGSPREVGEDFTCSNNRLTTLEGAPEVIGKTFECENNQLTDLKGAPQKIGWDFWCRRNELTSLDGLSTDIGGELYSSKNPVSEGTFISIFEEMKRGNDYIQSVELVWPDLSDADKALLYRPEFSWVSDQEIKSIKAMLDFNKIKWML